MKKYLLGLAAIVLAVAASAFTAPKTISAAEMNSRPTIQTWYYTGTTVAGDRVPGAYQTTSLSCSVGQEVPCQIQFDASSYMIPTTNTPLENYLDSFSTDGALKDAAHIRKSD